MAAGTVNQGTIKGNLDASRWVASQWKMLCYAVLGMSAVGICLMWLMESVDMRAMRVYLGRGTIDASAGDAKAAAAVMWEHAMGKRKGMMDARKEMLDGYKYSEKTAYDAFEADFSCPCENRIGKLFGDGGKFVCGGPEQFGETGGGQKICKMLSVGSNGDFSFETGIKEAYGCDIYTIDPTGDSDRFAEQARQLGTHFAAIGLAGKREQRVNEKTNRGVEYMPIIDVLEKLNIADSKSAKIDFMKIDCEGCEFASFEHIFDAMEQGRMEPVGQFFVEIHGTDDQKIQRLFERFDQLGYFVFHKERNHWG
eukprot:jgi/Picsp_1/1775/NSC_05247-R1_protein